MIAFGPLCCRCYNFGGNRVKWKIEGLLGDQPYMRGELEAPEEMVRNILRALESRRMPDTEAYRSLLPKGHIDYLGQLEVQELASGSSRRKLGIGSRPRFTATEIE